MIIKKISIKNFGKLSDVNIFPKDGLNVISGANESGKTTLLSFLRYIFFGTKQKKEYKDLTFKERYMPWNSMPISGSCEIEYENINYSIQRTDSDGFSKLTVLNLDKGIEEKSITNPGHYFFGIGEKTFDNSFYLKDLSSISDFSDSGELISFLTNFPGEKTTYQKVKQELNDRLANINSTKRKNSLLSNVESQIENSNNQLRSLELKLVETEDKVSCIIRTEEQIEAVNKELEDLKLTKKVRLANEAKEEKEKLINEKKLIEKEILKSYTDNFLKNKDNNPPLDDLNEYPTVFLKKPYFKIKFLIIIFSLAALGIGFSVLAVNFGYLFLIPSFLTFLCLFFLVIKQVNNKTISTSQLEYMQKRLSDINHKLDLCKNLSDSFVSSDEMTALDTNFFTNTQLDDIINRKIKELHDLTDGLNKLIHYKNEVYVLKNDIISVKNELNRLYCEKEKLKNEANIIERSIDILECSFAIAKKSVFPDLAKRTLQIFNYISNENYNSLNFDENFGIMFNKDSFFRTAKFLSSGSYDVLYLSLKTAIIEMISQPDSFMPVLMDDIFANCDDDRAERLMNVVVKLSEKHQIFLSTCRNREINFLKNNNANIIVM